MNLYFRFLSQTHTLHELYSNNTSMHISDIITKNFVILQSLEDKNAFLKHIVHLIKTLNIHSIEFTDIITKIFEHIDISLESEKSVECINQYHILLTYIIKVFYIFIL